ncbi:unnamed protein product [Eruca vesicaria subsp. sativa]|uniref:Uncharacterized protein n=1 Tax=Eruca vesicaria subsp. sativa TaxID=29727 RepID=A0ABC8JLF3_ERUVS|nr:unnamed protein product [Eruca vesicaria subsp. sativa]
MANICWTNEEMNQHSATSSEESKPLLKNNTGFAMVWTPEEQTILDNALIREAENTAKNHSSESCVLRYARISLEFPQKTAKDIAMRCRWINELKRVTESSNSAPQDPVIDEVINQNEKLLSQIFDNLSYPSKLVENLTLFKKARENMMKLLDKLNENVADQMKHMPPLPEELNDELFDFIVQDQSLP